MSRVRIFAAVITSPIAKDVHPPSTVYNVYHDLELEQLDRTQAMLKDLGNW